MGMDTNIPTRHTTYALAIWRLSCGWTVEGQDTVIAPVEYNCVKYCHQVLSWNVGFCSESIYLLRIARNNVLMLMPSILAMLALRHCCPPKSMNNSSCPIVTLLLSSTGLPTSKIFSCGPNFNSKHNFGLLLIAYREHVRTSSSSAKIQEKVDFRRAAKDPHPRRWISFHA